jgi:hypothetical protein
VVDLDLSRMSVPPSNQPQDPARSHAYSSLHTPATSAPDRTLFVEPYSLGGFEAWARTRLSSNCQSKEACHERRLHPYPEDC